MDKIIDKAIIAIGVAASLLIMELTTMFVVCMLIALSISALLEILALNSKLTLVLLILPLVAALMFQTLIFWLPLIAYDCLRTRHVLLKIVWVLPIIFGISVIGLNMFAYTTILALISCALSVKTQISEQERHSNTVLRDELRELSIALVNKNQELQSRQEFEVQLATLNERARIAREIHDNVGHLLTRSVLQLEAAAIVNAKDNSVKMQLDEIGATLHEAFDTVRASVHDMHEDAFDLQTQLLSLAQKTNLNIIIENNADDILESIGYSFLAIIREAIANTINHSDATELQLAINSHPAIWQLIIKDNGKNKACNNSKQPSGKGLGLRSMNERVRAMGGVFRTDWDNGFQIFISVPKELKANKHLQDKSQN